MITLTQEIAVPAHKKNNWVSYCPFCKRGCVSDGGQCRHYGVEILERPDRRIAFYYREIPANYMSAIGAILGNASDVRDEFVTHRSKPAHFHTKHISDGYLFNYDQYLAEHIADNSIAPCSIDGCKCHLWDSDTQTYRTEALTVNGWGQS